MRPVIATTIAAALSLLVYAQIDDQRWNEIRQKHQRAEKITEEERDYYESRVERKNQAESAVRQANFKDFRVSVGTVLRLVAARRASCVPR
jgi:hypothetical protein